MVAGIPEPEHETNEADTEHECEKEERGDREKEEIKKG